MPPQLKSRFSELQIPDNTLTEDDERLLPPKPMDWYPDNLAWWAPEAPSDAPSAPSQGNRVLTRHPTETGTCRSQKRL